MGLFTPGAASWGTSALFPVELREILTCGSARRECVSPRRRPSREPVLSPPGFLRPAHGSQRPLFPRSPAGGHPFASLSPDPGATRDHPGTASRSGESGRRFLCRLSASAPRSRDGSGLLAGGLRLGTRRRRRGSGSGRPQGAQGPQRRADRSPVVSETACGDRRRPQGRAGRGRGWPAVARGTAVTLGEPGRDTCASGAANMTT